MVEKGWLPPGGVVLCAGLALAILVAVLAGLTFNADLTTGGSQPPPLLPPLIDLPPGRGLDWSQAGYRGGQVPLPSPPPAFDVRDFGAAGDGVANDTAALQAALDAAHEGGDGGVVFLPPGIYLLDRPLSVTKPNIVIRGAGEGSTTIYIPVALSDVFEGTWSQDASGTVRSPWLTRGGFISFTGQRQRSNDRSTRLANVKGSVAQDAVLLTVDSTSQFRLGQWVRIMISDASTDARPGDQEIEEGEADVAPEAAVQAAAAAGDAPAGGGEGAAAQLRAAPSGSIVAFIYGDGLADSGSPGEVVGSDDVAFTARVASIGEDWVALDRELPFPVKPQWRGVVHRWEPSVTDGGVEQLTIAFSHTLAGPHLTERGRNALHIEYAARMWVRGVRILNADNGLRARGVDRSTFTDITVDVTEPRWLPDDGRPVNGHHALALSRGHANLLTRFNVAAPYYHDVSLENGALLNVIARGGGANLNLDLHRSGPWGNLFTQLAMGEGRRPFDAGGRGDRGAHSGRQTTFWNLRAGGGGALGPAPAPATAPAPAPDEPLPLQSRMLLGSQPGGAWRRRGPPGLARWWAPGGRRLAQDEDEAPAPERLPLPDCSFGPLLNFVGAFSGSQCNATGWLVGGLPEDKPDLHAAQVEARRGPAARTPAPAPSPHDS